LWLAGWSIEEIEAETLRSVWSVRRVTSEVGGEPAQARRRTEGALSYEEREEISRFLAAGWSLRAIARQLVRAPSTICREVNANGGREAYRAWQGEARAAEAARRPQQRKLVANRRLAGEVTAMLEEEYSPEQIAGRLRLEYPSDPEMWVSHETIYQSLFVQGRGGLNKELNKRLRTGRTQRRPRKGRVEGRGKIPGMVMIADRPAEVEDRAVPGHWEGDLIMGAGNRSAVATLVERTSRFVMLAALDGDHTAETVSDALQRLVPRLPAELFKTLTWDQGSEMARHAEFSVATGVDVYFCDPHSPWQRPSNENTNGLLRQYLPKGSDLSVWTQDQLDAFAARLNGRPRKTHGWLKPSEVLNELLVAVTT